MQIAFNQLNYLKLLFSEKKLNQIDFSSLSLHESLFLGSCYLSIKVRINNINNK